MMSLKDCDIYTQSLLKSLGPVDMSRYQPHSVEPVSSVPPPAPPITTSSPSTHLHQHITASQTNGLTAVMPVASTLTKHDQVVVVSSSSPTPSTPTLHHAHSSLSAPPTYPQPLPSSPEKQTFPCDVCGKVLGRRDHLRRHLVVHSDEAPYCCHQCDKRFKRPDHLKKHLAVHTDDTPNPCELCGKFFKRRDYLSRHLRRHAGLLPPRSKSQAAAVEGGEGRRVYTCSVCQVTFRKARQQEEHMLLHLAQPNRDKPFHCRHCGEKFCWSEELANHLRSTHYPPHTPHTTPQTAHTTPQTPLTTSHTTPLTPHTTLQTPHSS